MAKKKADPVGELATIERELGIHCLVFDEIVRIPRLATGVPELTTLLGGGWPKSRIVEVYAVEGIGKTSLMLQSCGVTQAAFLAALAAGEPVYTKNSSEGVGRAAYVDIENKYDPYYASNQFGIIHPKDLGTKKNPKVEDNGYRIYRTKTQEEASNLIDRLVQSGLFDLIVADSAAAMCPQAEFEGEIGSIKGRQMQARIMSLHMRKVAPRVVDQPASVIYINQSRVIGTNNYGKNIYEAPGAKAFKHHAAMRVSMWRHQALKQGSKETGTVVGAVVGVRVVKSQCGPEQGAKGYLRFYNGEGFCQYSEPLELAIAHDIITKSEKGGYYYYKGKTIAQGWKKLREWAAKYSTTFNKIKAEVDSAQADDQEILVTQEDDTEFSF